MKKIVSSGLIVMLLSSYVMGGENLEASKKFWSGVSSFQTGSGLNPVSRAVLTVGAMTAMGVSNLVAAGMDSISGNKDINTSEVNKNNNTFKINPDINSSIDISRKDYRPWPTNPDEIEVSVKKDGNTTIELKKDKLSTNWISKETTTFIKDGDEWISDTYSNSFTEPGRKTTKTYKKIN